MKRLEFTRQLFVFTDEDLKCMLNYHGVLHIRTDDGLDFDFMSERQYKRMHPEDPNCPNSNILRKNGDACGTMVFCKDCEWWKDYIQREEPKDEG